MPKNCNECEYHNSCNSYYGGEGCQREKEIRENKERAL